MSNNKFIKEIKKLKPSKELLKVFTNLNREAFFDPFFKDKLYKLAPIPIGHGESSDEIGILTRMVDLLQIKKSDTVLEVGTGSGYSTALLASMAERVVTLDINEQLLAESKERLISLGFFNVRYLAGDCSQVDDRMGLFDKIIIHAACMHSPYAVLNLVREDGLAVFPMGPASTQQLVLYQNKKELWTTPLGKYNFLETCQCSPIKGQYSSENKNIDIILETGDGTD